MVRKARVPILPRKLRYITVPLENLEKSWNFVIFNKNS